MEDALAQNGAKIMKNLTVRVLILVVMEDALALFFKTS